MCAVTQMPAARSPPRITLDCGSSHSGLRARRTARHAGSHGRHEETRRIIDDRARSSRLRRQARQAPLPATAESRGEKTSRPAAIRRTGTARASRRFLPAAAIGLSQLDPQVLPGTGGTRRQSNQLCRLRAGRSIGGVTNPMTRANGLLQDTLAALGDSPGYLVICGVGALVLPPAAARWPTSLPARFFVLLSWAERGAASRAGTDEARNPTATRSSSPRGGHRGRKRVRRHPHLGARERAGRPHDRGRAPAVRRSPQPGCSRNTTRPGSLCASSIA